MTQQYEHIDTHFPTFNGLNRSAMFLGVPIVPMAMVTLGLTLASMIMMVVFGIKMLLLMGLVLPVFFAFRTISANDDQAIRVYGKEFKWYLRRQKARLYKGILTVQPIKYGRQQIDYQRFMAQYSAKTTDR